LQKRSLLESCIDNKGAQKECSEMLDDWEVRGDRGADDRFLRKAWISNENHLQKGRRWLPM
jgi:hypothetical protein